MTRPAWLPSAFNCTNLTRGERWAAGSDAIRYPSGKLRHWRWTDRSGLRSEKTFGLSALCFHLRILILQMDVAGYWDYFELLPASTSHTGAILAFRYANPALLSLSALPQLSRMPSRLCCGTDTHLSSCAATGFCRHRDFPLLLCIFSDVRTSANCRSWHYALCSINMLFSLFLSA
jgi:hypothetical protein